MKNLVLQAVASALMGITAAVSSSRQLLDLDAIYSAQGDSNQLYSKLYNDTMEWGTYKPNLFFGIKNRAPSPLTVGMIWAVPGQHGGFAVRHTYQYQSGDGVTAYFEYHDGWGSCRQIVEDPAANARFEIDFVKSIYTEEEEG